METIHLYGLTVETVTTSLSNILLAKAITEPAQIQGKEHRPLSLGERNTKEL